MASPGPDRREPALRVATAPDASSATLPVANRSVAPRLAAPSASWALEDAPLDPMFAATAEATEEAVLDALSLLNPLWFARDVTGPDGRTVTALPHDDVLELLAVHGRLER